MIIERRIYGLLSWYSFKCTISTQVNRIYFQKPSPKPIETNSLLQFIHISQPYTWISIALSLLFVLSERRVLNKDKERSKNKSKLNWKVNLPYGNQLNSSKSKQKDMAPWSISWERSGKKIYRNLERLQCIPVNSPLFTHPKKREKKVQQCGGKAEPSWCFQSCRPPNAPHAFFVQKAKPSQWRNKLPKNKRWSVKRPGSTVLSSDSSQSR